MNATVISSNTNFNSNNLTLHSSFNILHSHFDKVYSSNTNFNSNISKFKMLNLDLNHIFKARGIDKPYTFLVKAGFTPHTASTICTNSTRTFKLDHIELLCKALVFEPNDLLSYKANKGEVLTADHPLLKLKHSEIEQSWKQTIAKIPYNQLKELSKSMTKKE